MKNRKYSIKWLKINRNMKGTTVLLDRNEVIDLGFKSTKVSFTVGFNPTMAFNIWDNVKDRIKNRICLIDQRPEEGRNSYLRTFQCFAFDKKTGKASDSYEHVLNKILKDAMKNNQIKYPNDSSIMTNVRFNRQLIAIFLNYTSDRHHFLHIEGKTITYCSTKRRLFNIDVSIMFYVQLYP